MSKPSTPEHGRRPGTRQSTASKTKSSGRKAEWDFNTFSSGAVWSNHMAGTSQGESFSRPGTSSGRPATSAPNDRDSGQEDEAPAQVREAPAAKAKASKVSADLSPYISGPSPYLAKTPVTAHPRPISRMGGLAAAPVGSTLQASYRRSTSYMPYAPSSRPVTPAAQPSRPSTSQGPGDQPGARTMQRPTTQPAGYRSQSQREQFRAVVAASALAPGGPSPQPSTSQGPGGGPKKLASTAVYHPGQGMQRHGAPQAGTMISGSSSSSARSQQIDASVPRPPPEPHAPRGSVPHMSGHILKTAERTDSRTVSSPSRPGSVAEPSAPQHGHQVPPSQSREGQHAKMLQGKPEQRVSAVFAISGLGIIPDSRPTTQERHAAQREQLGFGKRPTTQERRQLTTRAGPRSAQRTLSTDCQPQSRGGPSDDLSARLRGSFGGSSGSEPSRLSTGSGGRHDAATAAAPAGARGGSRAGGSRGRADEGARSPEVVPVVAENTDGEAYGMTLSDYISQMKTDNWGTATRPQSGASATMAVEDCIPPDNASLLSDCSVLDPEESGWESASFSEGDDGDNLDVSTSSEFEDPTMPSSQPWNPVSTSRSFTTAAENGLDLRPATAAVGMGSSSLQHMVVDEEAPDTKQVDLASLPAALFHPRSEESTRRPSGSGRSDSVWHHAPNSGRRSSRRSDGFKFNSHKDLRSSRGGSRKTQSARPIFGPGETGAQGSGSDADGGEDSDDDKQWEHPIRPPSRQRPPPEALHLFNGLGQTRGALHPSFSMQISDKRSMVHRPRTTAAPSRPLSGPQLRLKSDGSGFENATKSEVKAASKLSRPPSRGRGPAVLSAGIRHNAAEDFPEPPPKGQGEYDLDIMGVGSDSECEV
mmetsp:Transcript_23123/g.64244  ORF Transcript_23123/g.64244 Transcript_23123/m.64244 type:complete len:873 (+) Transcript_23123:158-2776(+)